MTTRRPHLDEDRALGPGGRCAGRPCWGGEDRRDVSVAAGVGTRARTWQRGRACASAVAAQVLADDLGIQTENTAKWLDAPRPRRRDVPQGWGPVIVDEASLAGTLSFDRITALAAEAGAKVLLVGDHASFSPSPPVARSPSSSTTVTTPGAGRRHRFVHPWEKTASLALRHGRTDVIDTYTEHGRIRGGETEEMIDVAYTAWRNSTRRASQCARDHLERVRPGAQQPGTR